MGKEEEAKKEVDRGGKGKRRVIQHGGTAGKGGRRGMDGEGGG
jgi:hypothetical protein